MKTTYKQVYALCTQDMKPVIEFSDREQLDRWIARQEELHGKKPNCKPCLITYTVETEELQ